jgi:RHS repeat-associated protein
MSGLDRATAVGGILTKGAQNAGGLEQANQQMGHEASAFDVWTHSYDGMSQRMRDFADDPAGALARGDGGLGQAVSAGLTGPWHSSSPSAVADSIAAQAAGLGNMVQAIGDAKGALATVGATFTLLTGVEQMLSTLVSVIPFPALPAIRILDMDVGLPHAHNHPPNLIPPAPPVPLPSTGPIIPIPILSGAVRTLINGMPAARCGDMGLGVWCGGFFPMYEVFLGSSNVWIEGSRAGRLAVDITKHCIFTVPKPMDPPMGPMVGVTVMASANVLIGGVPMPSLLSLAMAAAIKGLLKGLGKAARALERATRGLRQRLFRNMKPGFLKCLILRAEPVDVVTGEVVVDQQDFSILGRIPIVWSRHYGSRSLRRGVCGHGWDTPADARLVFEPDGAVVFHDGTAAPTLFPAVPARRPVMELVDGAWLERAGDSYVVKTKPGLVYHFPVSLARREEILIGHVQDQFGNSLRFIRDENGLRRIEESAGRIVEVTSVNGLVRRMDLRHPQAQELSPLVRFDYDRTDNLVAVYDALGVPYRFAYTDHRLIRHTDRNGLSFSYEYDAPSVRGRCVHTWGDGGLYDYRFTFHEAERRTTLVDSLGHTWQVKYDYRFLITDEIDPLGGVTRYEYDSAGRTSAVVDPAGHRTEWLYDAQGNVLRQVLPDASTTLSRYDQDNLLVEATDPNGASWQLRYDRRRVQERRTPRGAVWRYDYTSQGDLRSEIDPEGNRSLLEYDAFGNLAALQDGSGLTRRFQYDAAGRLVVELTPAGAATRYVYDRTGRVQSIQFPSGSACRFAYDHAGNLVEFLDQKGRRTRFRYAGLGQLVARLDQDGTTVTFEYDTEEQRVAVVNQRGERYSFVRDELGRVVREVDYWGQAVAYTLDAAGNITEVVDPLGRSARIAYDALGRMTQRIYADGATERFGYDANGNLVAAENDTSAVRRQFDEEGNLVVETQGQFTVKNTFDLLGRRLQRESGHGNVLRIAYDATDHPTEMDLNGQTILRAAYGPGGRLSEALLGRHLRRKLEYNTDGRLVHQELRSAAVIGSRGYGYDAVGNLVERTNERGGTQIFTYDSLDRVTRYAGPGHHTFELHYDPAGDLLRTVSGFDSSGRGIRATQYRDTRYEFDRAGNAVRRVTGRGATTFNWDGANRLSGAVNERGLRSTYAYDALGRRRSKQVNGVTTNFYWDGEVLLAEDSTGGGSRREYVFLEGTFEPVAYLATEIFYIDADHVSLPHDVVNERGEVVWSAAYGPTGDVLRLDGRPSDCPLRFQGQYHDEELGLSYNMYRYCDMSTATFLSEDPLGLAAGVNPYQTPPNVWRWSDPLGLNCRFRDPRTGEWVTLTGHTADEARSMYRHFLEQGMTPGEAARALIELDEVASHAHNPPNPNAAGTTSAAPGYRPTGRRPRGGGLDPNSLAARRRGRGRG